MQAKSAKSKDKSYKLADGGGLYLEVMPTGSKLWRMKFKQTNGKESRLAFGSYPETTLAEARTKRAEARKLSAGGIDPAQAKRLDKITKTKAAENTFGSVAWEWHTNKIESWQTRTAKNVLDRLEKNIFP